MISRARFATSLAALLAVIAPMRGAHALETPTPAPCTPTFRFASSTYSATEEQGVVTLTIQRECLGQATSVNYSTANITATSGGDYTGVSGILNFGANDTSKTIDVIILNDTVADSGETFRVTLSGSGITSPDQTTVTISDGVPTVSISASPASGLESDEPTAKFTVSLSASPSSSVSVPISLSGTAARYGANIITDPSLESPTDRWWLNSENNKGSFTRTNEDAFFGGYCARFSATTMDGWMIPSYNLDLDIPTGGLAIQPYTLSFYARAEATRTLWAHIAGSNSLDLMADLGNVTVTPTWKRYTLTFTPLHNGGASSNHYPNLRFSAFADDLPLTLYIDGLKLEPGSSVTKFGDYELFGKNLISNSDLESAATNWTLNSGGGDGTFSWVNTTAYSGSYSAKYSATTFGDWLIPTYLLWSDIHPDGLSTTDQYVLSYYAKTDAARTLTGTIGNGNGSGVIAYFGEVEFGTSWKRYEYFFTPPITGAAPDYPGIKLGALSNDVPFTLYWDKLQLQKVSPLTTVTFAAGETVKTIEMPVIDDRIYEDDDAITTTLGTPTGADLSATNAQATFTILEDDAAPAAHLEGLPLSVPESDTGASSWGLAVLRLAHSNTEKSLEIPVSYSGSATPSVDYDATDPISVTVSPGQGFVEFGISTNDDEDVELDEFAVIGLQASPTVPVDEPSSGTITIVDDDVPAVAIVATSSSYVLESSTKASVGVSLSAATSRTVDVAFETADGTALSGSDYSQTSGTLTFLPGQVLKQIEVPILLSPLQLPNRTFTVSLVGTPTNALLGSPSAKQVTIIDGPVFDDGYEEWGPIDTLYTPPANRSVINKDIQEVKVTHDGAFLYIYLRTNVSNDYTSDSKIAIAIDTGSGGVGLPINGGALNADLLIQGGSLYDVSDGLAPTSETKASGSLLTFPFKSTDTIEYKVALNSRLRIGAPAFPPLGPASQIHILAYSEAASQGAAIEFAPPVGSMEYTLSDNGFRSGREDGEATAAATVAYTIPTPDGMPRGQGASATFAVRITPLSGTLLGPFDVNEGPCCGRLTARMGYFEIGGFNGEYVRDAINGSYTVLDWNGVYNSGTSGIGSTNCVDHCAPGVLDDKSAVSFVGTSVLIQLPNTDDPAYFSHKQPIPHLVCVGPDWGKMPSSASQIITVSGGSGEPWTWQASPSSAVQWLDDSQPVSAPQPSGSCTFTLKPGATGVWISGTSSIDAKMSSYYRIGNPPVPPPGAQTDFLYEPPNLIPEEDGSDPIFLFSGEFHHTEQDLVIPGRELDINWTRTYRSMIDWDSSESTELPTQSLQGDNWDFSYNIFIEDVVARDEQGDPVLDQDGNEIPLFLRLHSGNTRQDVYLPLGGDVWEAPGFFNRITKQGEIYTVEFSDKTEWVFYPTPPGEHIARLHQIVGRPRVADPNPNRNVIELVWTGDKLVQLTDTIGRVVNVTYTTVNGKELIWKVKEAFGDQREWTYTYDNSWRLTSVTVPGFNPAGESEHAYPTGKTTAYEYDGNSTRIWRIVDPAHQPSGRIEFPSGGGPYLTNLYDEFGRVSDQVWGAAGDWVNIAYLIEDDEEDIYSPVDNATGMVGAKAMASVKDREGNLERHYFDQSNRLIAQREYTGKALAADELPSYGKVRPAQSDVYDEDPEYFETRYFYNPDSLRTKVLFPKGNFITYTYAEGDARKRGNLLKVEHLSGSVLTHDTPIVTGTTSPTGTCQ